MSIKIFYNPRQSARSNTSFSPSAQKPALVMESWQQLPVLMEVIESGEASLNDLLIAHSEEYVFGVMNGEKNNGFGNKSPDVIDALPFVVGSMIDAAVHAATTGEPSFSPTSGAHHAGYARGGGFCTFNFLVIAAEHARRVTDKSVAILDFDNHYGDGTEDIRLALELDWLQHKTFGGMRVGSGASADEWIKTIPEMIQSFGDIGLLIYNAGVDSHVDDPLGGVLTSVQMRDRDLAVFQTCADLGIPVAVSLAGGYQKDAEGHPGPVLKLHDNTLMTCADAYQEFDLDLIERVALHEAEKAYHKDEWQRAADILTDWNEKSPLKRANSWLLLGVCLGNLQHHELARDAFLKSMGRGASNLASVNYLTSLLATDDIDKALRSFDMVFHGASDREQGVILENMVEAIRRGQVEREELPERLRELIGNVEVI